MSFLAHEENGLFIKTSTVLSGVRHGFSTRRTVQRALSDLEHHGFLERTHRRRPNGSLTSSLYRIK